MSERKLLSFHFYDFRPATSVAIVETGLWQDHTILRLLSSIIQPDSEAIYWRCPGQRKTEGTGMRSHIVCIEQVIR